MAAFVADHSSLVDQDLDVPLPAALPRVYR
jgi:hypothetical protein